MVAVGVATAMAGAFYLTHLEEVPMTGRKHFVVVSKAYEEELAKETYAELMKKYQRQLLPANDPITQRVRAVGSRIAAVTGLTNVKWEFHVINSPEKNAFVLPGGKVFVFTGILPVMANDDGMAAVLGHEIGHQLARHGAEKISLNVAIGVMQLIVSLMIGTNADQLGRLLFGLLLELPYSRKWRRRSRKRGFGDEASELEADYIGPDALVGRTTRLLLMSKACYNPAEAVNLWLRMNRVARNEPLSFISTHPSHLQRVERINLWLPEAQRAFQDADCAHTLSQFRRATAYAWS